MSAERLMESQVAGLDLVGRCESPDKVKFGVRKWHDNSHLRLDLNYRSNREGRPFPQRQVGGGMEAYLGRNDSLERLGQFAIKFKPIKSTTFRW